MSTDELAKTIWDYMFMHQKLEKADAIVVFGSSDVRSAEYGADLFLQGWAPLLVLSGNTNPAGYTRELWGMSEAEKFALVAESKGVPREAMLIEDRSMSTGENIRFSKEILESNGIQPKRIIVVQKPYMERRTYATIKKQWPEVEVIVSSTPISYEEYPNKELSKEKIINTMVGDLQRIREYPARGFQIEQYIPEEVWNAYEQLVQAGFDKRLVTQPTSHPAA